MLLFLMLLLLLLPLLLPLLLLLLPCCCCCHSSCLPCGRWVLQLHFEDDFQRFFASIFFLLPFMFFRHFFPRVHVADCHSSEFFCLFFLFALLAHKHTCSVQRLFLMREVEKNDIFENIVFQSIAFYFFCVFLFSSRSPLRPKERGSGSGARVQVPIISFF